MSAIEDVYNLTTRSDTKGLKSAEKEAGALGKALKGLGKIGAAPFNAIKGAIGGIGKALGGAVKSLAIFGLAARGLKQIQRIFGGIFNAIKNASPQMAKAITDLQEKFKTLFGPILAKAGAALTPVIEKIAKLLDDPRIQKFINLLTGAFLDAVVGIATFITDTLIPAIANFSDMLAPLSAQISGPLSQAWETFKSVVSAVWEWISTNVITPLINAWHSLEPEFAATWQAILAWWNANAPKIQAVIDQLFGEQGSITMAVRKGIAIIGDVLKIAMDILRGDWDQAWNDLGVTAQNSLDFLRNITQGIADVIGGLFGVDLSNVFEKAVTTITQFGTIIVIKFVDLINGLIDGLNGGVDAINSVLMAFTSQGVKDIMQRSGLDPTTFGFIGHVGRVPYPSLATGGIVKTPMLATVGDAPASKGGEVVAPLKDLMGMIQKAIGAGVVVKVYGPFGEGYTPQDAGRQAGDGFLKAIRASGGYG